MQLFCFTYAGGTTAFFNQLEEAVGKDIEFIKLEYPGHGTRIKERLCENFRDVVTDLYPFMKEKYNGGEYGLLGYSMGSFSAIEMYRYLSEIGELSLPKHIFIAAHTPNVMINFDKIGEKDIDEFVKKRTVDFGAVPKQLINNNSFWRMYLPIYKADYLMISRYSLDKYNFKSNIPLTVFYSEKDTPLNSIKEWDKYFENPVEYIQYDGPHFFIKDYYLDMAKVIAERLGV